MVRWIATWLALALVGLAVARLVIRPAQESWWLVSAGRDDAVLVAQYTVGNTGLFADQLTTRVLLLRPDGSPLAHRAIRGPARLDGDGVHGALDTLDRTGDAWELRVEGDAMRVRARAEGLGTACPPAPGRLDGFLDIPDASASSEGARLDGAAVLTHIRSTGTATLTTALYAVDRDGSVVIDPLAACGGFLVLDGRGAAVRTAPLPYDLDERLDLELAGHRVVITPGRRQWTEPAFDGAFGAEALLARAVGYHEPTVTFQRVRVEVDGRTPWAGVLVVRDGRGG